MFWFLSERIELQGNLTKPLTRAKSNFCNTLTIIKGIYFLYMIFLPKKGKNKR